MFESLIHLDIYKVDKKFNVSEDQSENSQTTENNIGSKVGGTFTAALYFIVLYQFTSSIVRMHQGIDDNQSYRSRTNYLRDGENIIDTAKSQFLPNIEMVNFYDEELAKTILNDDGIDMEELLTYFEPNIVVR